MIETTQHSPRWAEAGRKSGAVTHKAAQVRLADLMEKVFVIVSEAADAGLPSPSSCDMAGRLSASRSTVQRALLALEDEGRIRRFGPANLTRRIEIVATGRQTAPAVYPGRPRYAAPVPAGEKLPEEVKSAKLFLMRTYPVFRAKTRYPKADPAHWVIGHLGRDFTDAGLIAEARKRGWQG